jgi:hypothetical protein
MAIRHLHHCAVKLDRDELVKLSAIVFDFAQHGVRGRRQAQSPHPPVLGIGTAFDKPTRLEPIHQSCDRDGLDLNQCRQLIITLLQGSAQLRRRINRLELYICALLILMIWSLGVHDWWHYTVSSWTGWLGK